MVGMIGQIIVTIGLWISNNMYIDYALVLIMGWAVTGKHFVGYSYLLELQPQNKQVFVGTAMLMFEALAYLSICAYFYFISKWWHYIEIPTISLALLGVVCSYFLPESPRYLLSQHKFEHAKEVFSVIAKWNGKYPDIAKEFVFKDEID